MSQSGDPSFAVLLDRLRLRELTFDDVKALNARDINNPSHPIPTFPIGSDVSTRATAFANNAPRVLYNHVIIAAKVRSGITAYRLLADSRRRGAPCHDAYLREYYRLLEDLTGVPCLGMGRVHRQSIKIVVTSNISTILGIANGTLAIIPSINFPASNNFRSANCAFGGRANPRPSRLKFCQHPLSLKSPAAPLWLASLIPSLKD